MKTKELRAMNGDDLNNKLTEIGKELMKDNAQVAIGTPPKNTGKIKLAKKTIARIKTILTEREAKKQTA